MKEIQYYRDFKYRHKQKGLPETALGYVLLALVPYTKPNLKLSFAPSMFFADLAKINRNKVAKTYQIRTLRNAYYKAQREGYLTYDSRVLSITPKGFAALQPYKPKKMANANIMVVFDIPESQGRDRRALRLLLRQLGFTQIQKSVWVSEYECESVVRDFVELRKLAEYVKLFECSELNIVHE